MKITLFIFTAFLAVAAYYGIFLYRKLEVSRALVAGAARFELIAHPEAETTMLVLGDSTAVGVGAKKPEDSLPALVAEAAGAGYVENLARSGARTEDLKAQADAAQRGHYTYILVQIGGNDIIRFESAAAAARELAAALETLPRTDHLVVLSAGNVGGATFFPWFLRPLYTSLNLKYHTAFAASVARAGGTYVNLYEPPATDPFVQRPETYLAEDGLHPSSAGYRIWFQELQEQTGIRR